LFCVLHFAKSQSGTTVKHEFTRKFNNDPPDNNIRPWYQQFQVTDCDLANFSTQNNFSCGIATFIPSAAWRLK
jgi:hypothetical protein